MCTDVILRKTGFDRISDVSTTLTQCWKYAYKDLVNSEYLSSLKNNHWVEFIEKCLNDKTADCIIAEMDGKIIGVSIFGKSITSNFPYDGEIISLYVIPEFIGRNVGHLLFENAQQSIKEQGYSDCIICAFAENIKAIGFYKSHGYGLISQNEKIRMGEQELQYVIMRKKL